MAPAAAALQDLCRPYSSPVFLQDENGASLDAIKEALGARKFISETEVSSTGDGATCPAVTDA
jgi:hypothetical protein